MRKKLLIDIVVIILISSIFLLALSWCITKNERIKMESSYLDITISQVVENMKNNSNNLEKAHNIFLNDYINRSNFISYFIEEDDNGIIDLDEWNKIIDVTEVRDIYIIDKNGTITQSSKNEAIGINFYNTSTFETFIPLIEGKEKKGYAVIYDGISVIDGMERVYVGIALKDNGILMVDADKEILPEYEQAISVKEIISVLPTRVGERIFAIGKDTGNIMGSSDMSLYDVDNRIILDYVKYVLNNPQIVSINDEKELMLSKEYNDTYVVMSVSMEQIIEYVKSSIIQYIIIIFVICFLIIGFLYVSIKKLIIDDIDNIGAKLNEFCEGKNDIVFNSAKTTEISQLIEKLYKVINALETKNERISSIISMMGDGFGAYEYYSELNQIYISENLPELIGKSEEEIKKSIKRFFEEENSRIQKSGGVFDEKNEYETYNNKIVKVRRKLYKNAIYAFIEDITEQKERDTRLSTELKRTKEANARDTLTKLYNRKKVEEEVNKFIKSEHTHKGVIILIDLDNFKNVNDMYGHLKGDELLIKFAGILSNHFRDTDIISRIGGDEFIIFINNNVDEEVLINKMENLLEIIKKELNENFNDVNVSGSIGIAYIDDNINTFEDVYKQADEAMYSAKNQGKDCFFISK